MLIGENVSIIGENVSIESTKDKAIITIDLGYRGNLSSTGKTVRVASTLGNKKIEGTEIQIGLNAYIKA